MSAAEHAERFLGHGQHAAGSTRAVVDYGKEVAIHLYGQEINPETFAISKADLLLKGEGAEAENLKFGSTLSADAFPSQEFDFMLSNPPYGKSWKTDLERMGGKGEIKDPRFVITHADDPEFSLATQSSDGQLIDASGWSRPLRKNLGKKNCELADEHIQRICGALLAFEETGQSKIFPNEVFGSWKITVDRPLRLSVDMSEETLKRFRGICRQADEAPLANLGDRVAKVIGPGPHRDYNRYLAAAGTEADRRAVKLTAKRLKLLQTGLARKDETAEPVIRKRSRPRKDADAAHDTLHGRYHVTIDGAPAVVEYEPDTELRDTEQIPLLEPGGIEAFFRREVLPHAADAWIDGDKTQIGYEISFTRYFYKPQPLRTLAEIEADIRALERESEGLLDQILGAA